MEEKQNKMEPPKRKSWGRQKMEAFQTKMCMIFVNYPERVFGIGCLVLLILCMIAGPNMEMSEATEYDWTVTSTAESKYEDITTDILLKLDSVDGSSSIGERTQLATDTALSIVYFPTEDDVAIFTPENVQTICKIDSVLWNMEEFETYCQKTSDAGMKMPMTKGDCITPTLSVVPRFYGWPPYGNATNRDCTLLSKDTIKRVEMDMFMQLSNPAYMSAYFLASNVDVKNPKSTIRTRSFLGLGGPLSGFSSMQDREEEQMKIYKDVIQSWETKMFDTFGMKNTLVKSAYRDKALMGNLQVKFFSQAFSQFEFGRVVNGDLLWTIASIIFVFVYMTIHTESFFIATIGIMQILFSIPISYFFYRFVFQVPFFTQLHILTIFLVLGVGADDIFVLTDAWKQGGSHEEFNQNTYTRMLYCYERAFLAIFNTSFTTAMAFLSTALSPIMPISAFGIFASIAIVVNYLYVVLFTPSALVIYHKYWENKKFCCCGTLPGKSAKNEIQHITLEDAKKIDLKALKTQQSKRLETEEAAGTLVVQGSSAVERFFSGPYTRVITNKYSALVIVTIFLGIMTQGLYFAFKLSPPTSQEEWFTKDHMSTGFGDLLSTGFLAGADDSYVSASFVWGVEDLNRDEFVHWYPSRKRGIAVFKQNFDISSAEAHNILLTTCDRLNTEKCVEAGCMDGTGDFIRSGSVSCWIKEMSDHHNGVIPTGDKFLPALKQFRANYPQHADSIGFIDDELKFVRIKFTLTLQKKQPFGTTNPINVKATAISDSINLDAPDSIGPSFVEAGRWFAWTRTEEGLVNGMYTGLGICMPVAFVVLLLATGNLFLAFYATVTIIGIVACVLGFCESIMGWSLGIAESISAVIVIGFSVDYVVHLGHMYEESPHSSRRARTADAAAIMAPTVAAGAVTTLGAGAFMFGCQMVFFSKMATLITVTIALSLFFSLGFFMCTCALVGPIGRMGQYKYLLKRS